MLKKAADLGYTMNVGPEAEFFLFKLDKDGNPTVDPHDAATYFDVAPIDRGEDCRRDIEVTLQQMGFESRLPTTRSRSASTRSTSATATPSRRPTT